MTKRGDGKGFRFLHWALQQDTDDCIEWPYFRMKNGYGQFGTYIGMSLAHRYICEHAHGAGGPQAAHRCGNRGCVNKRHIRWATAVENEGDKRSHGTYYTRITAAKLTEDRVRQIRADSELSYGELATKYATPRSTIIKVVKRWTWKHV